MTHLFLAGRIAPSVSTKFDAASMHERPQLAAETQLVDDGSGKITLYRLHRFQLETVPDKMTGCFFSGDCYILHYTYLHGTEEKHILYYWLVCGNFTVPTVKLAFSML
jgi:gelsolin